MQTVVIYDSTYGNTETIARCIARVLEECGPAQAVSVAEADKLDLQPGGLLVVGCPTQAHMVTSDMHAVLKHFQKHSLQEVKAAAFDTRFRRAAWLTGMAARQIERALRHAGATLLVPAESFFVSSARVPILEEGEMDRVAQWAEGLARQIEPTLVEQPAQAESIAVV
jgi:flavorubredoxin